MNRSIIDIEDFEDSDLSEILELANLFKTHFVADTIHRIVDHKKASKKLVYLLFSEPSTRTKVSFQTACAKLGVKAIPIATSKSSIAKGETIEDTLTVLQALQPDALIFRSKLLKLTPEELKEQNLSLINAGLGTQSHPTQALADLMTILTYRKNIKDEKILIVGDVLHSRVANSDLKLFKRLGAEVAYCSPRHFTPINQVWKDVKNFENLEDGVKWASILISLRVQEERHGDTSQIGFSVAEYRDKYRIGYDQLNAFASDGIILHPGPVIRGVEISNFALRDSRCRIMDQVKNGLYIRLALLCSILDLRI